MQNKVEQAQPAHNGSLGPSWRSILAQDLLSRRSLRQPGRIADQWLLDLQDYGALAAQGEAGLARAKTTYPALYQACELNERPEITANIKLAVLGDMPCGEISQRLGIGVAILEAWEMAYFDVRELRSATTWLATRVIEPERAAGNIELAGRMKLALGGGLVAARAMLDSDAALPLDEAQRLFQRKLKLALKLDQALEMPLATPKDALAFIKLHSKMELEQKHFELAERKLAQQCQAARDRHELAMRKLDLARERARPRGTGQAKQEPVHAGQPDPGQVGRDSTGRAGQLPQAVGLAQLRWGEAPQTAPSADRAPPPGKACELDMLDVPAHRDSQPEEPETCKMVPGYLHSGDQGVATEELACVS